MALNAAEEESIEALKRWWEENSGQLIAILVVAAVAVGGWYLLQSSRTQTANMASDLYEEVMQLAATAQEAEDKLVNRQAIKDLAATLKADFTDTIYARYAALFAAQQEVNAGDLGAAEAELQWVLDNSQGSLFKSADEALLLTTNLRLGRVILASGDTDRALDLVNRVDPGSLEADFAELRGDIYLAMGREVDARDSYLAAQQAGSSSQFLRMKLDALANES